MNMVLEQPTDLKSAWAALREEQPKLRIRNAARELGVSELALLLTELEQDVTPLTTEFGDMLIALESVGRVMALSRNDQVVHERHGVYTDFKVGGSGAMGLCLGEIDLRTFLKHWRYAVAVMDRPKHPLDNEGRPIEGRQSIQFFDCEGEAIHKVYATSHTDMAAWKQWVERFRAPSPVRFEPETRALPGYPSTGQVSQQEIREPWSALQDVHHFNAMLNKLGIDRLEALSLVGEDYALPLPVNTIEHALTLASEQKQSLMVFVGNHGIVQIHTGQVNRLLRTGPWFNVLDPDFNLHLNTDEIVSCWAVRRPTSDGIVTSIECFNADRQLVLTLFGERKPGLEELETWRQLVDTVSANNSHAQSDQQSPNQEDSA
ncbi:hemin-degrading factor [Hahella ganghwensis]|uniref:hemin-degrading factor n=1 Tax=Hahella ganghwensis TaxID=286420 RepID=UPI000364BA9A|nr:hemin-degrading factor [Hahella ganghwensis]